MASASRLQRILCDTHDSLMSKKDVITTGVACDPTGSSYIMRSSVISLSGGHWIQEPTAHSLVSLSPLTLSFPFCNCFIPTQACRNSNSGLHPATSALYENGNRGEQCMCLEHDFSTAKLTCAYSPEFCKRVSHSDRNCTPLKPSEYDVPKPKSIRSTTVVLEIYAYCPLSLSLSLALSLATVNILDFQWTKPTRSGTFFSHR
jgi:hypothetical protein